MHPTPPPHSAVRPSTILTLLVHLFIIHVRVNQHERPENSQLRVLPWVQDRIGKSRPDYAKALNLEPFAHFVRSFPLHQKRRTFLHSGSCSGSKAGRLWADCFLSSLRLKPLELADLANTLDNIKYIYTRKCRMLKATKSHLLNAPSYNYIQPNPRFVNLEDQKS